MDRDVIMWALVLFFGTSTLFGTLRRLTEDSSTEVTIAVQLAALAIVLAGVVGFVRWRGRRR